MSDTRPVEDPQREILSPEERITKEILARGNFAVFMPTVVNTADGQQIWAGFKAFTSPNLPIKGAYEIFREQELFGKCFDEDQCRRDGVLDSLRVRPCFQPGYLKTINPKTHQSERKFLGNKAQIDQQTREPLVRFIYNTTPAAADYFTDENTRPTTGFQYQLFVPKSLAEKIIQQVQQRPGFFREIVERTVLDRRGVQGNLKSLFPERDSHFVQRPEMEAGKHKLLFYNGGLPPYDQPQWLGSKIYLDIHDLGIPKEDVGGQELGDIIARKPIAQELLTQNSRNV